MTENPKEKFAPNSLRSDSKPIESLRCYAKRFLTFAISATSAVLIFYLSPLGEIRSSASTLTWVSLLSILILSIFLRVILSYFKAPKGAIHRTKSKLPDPDALNLRQEQAEISFIANADDVSVRRFLQHLIDPGSFVLRTTETVDLSGVLYTSSVVRTIAIPDSYDSNRMYIPILRPAKGQLLDRLSVSCGSKSIRTLSHRESQGAMIVALNLLLKTAFSAGKPENFEELSQEIHNAILSNDTPNLSTRKIITRKFKDAFQEKLRFSANAESNLAAAAFLEIFEKCLTSYFVIAVVEKLSSRHESFLRVSCEYSTGKAQLHRDIKGWKKRVYDIHDAIYALIRLTFGLTQRSHVLRLPLACESQSYHFRSTIPDGLYVYDHDATLVDASVRNNPQIVTGRASRPMDPDLRMSVTKGLSHVHAYARDLDVVASHRDHGQEQIKIPLVSIQLRERPPGLLFTVFLISLYLAALAIGVGAFHNLIFGLDVSSVDEKCFTLERAEYLSQSSQTCDMAPTPGSSWPAILFGIPAIVSAWLVSRFTQEAVAKLSISTIAVTSWCVLNAVFAVVLSALKLNLSAVWVVDIFNNTNTQPFWSLLTISAVGNFVMVTLLMFFRVRRYAERIHDWNTLNSSTLPERREDV